MTVLHVLTKRLLDISEVPAKKKKNLKIMNKLENNPETMLDLIKNPDLLILNKKNPKILLKMSKKNPKEKNS